MNMIWQGHESTWTEPIASAIATIFGFMPATARSSRILHRLVDSFTNFINILSLCAAIETCPLNRRTCKRLLPPS